VHARERRIQDIVLRTESVGESSGCASPDAKTQFPVSDRLDELSVSRDKYDANGITEEIV